MKFRHLFPVSLRHALIPVLLGLASGIAHSRPAAVALEFGAPGDATARRLAGVIDAVSRRHGVDGALVHAIIRAESSWDPEAVSPQGAVGLMQLMPETARRYGVRDPFDPAQNIEGGVRLLKDLLGQFERDLELSLAAYNSGANAVIRAGNRIPPNAETLAFVPRVIGYYESYRSAARAAQGEAPAGERAFVVARDDAIRVPAIDPWSSGLTHHGVPPPDPEKRPLGIVASRRSRRWHLARIRGSGAASSLFGPDTTMRDRGSDAGPSTPRRPKIQRPGTATPRTTALKRRRKDPA